MYLAYLARSQDGWMDYVCMHCRFIADICSQKQEKFMPVFDIERSKS